MICRRNASQALSKLGEQRQRADPAECQQDDSLHDDQPDGDPSPHRHSIGKAAEERIEDADAENPEDDRVGQLDVENGQLHVRPLDLEPAACYFLCRKYAMRSVVGGFTPSCRSCVAIWPRWYVE